MDDGWCVSGKRFVFVDERNDGDGESFVGSFGNVRCVVVGVGDAEKLVCGEKWLGEVFVVGDECSDFVVNNGEAILTWGTWWFGTDRFNEVTGRFVGA